MRVRSQPERAARSLRARGGHRRLRVRGHRCGSGHGHQGRACAAHRAQLRLPARRDGRGGDGHHDPRPSQLRLLTRLCATSGVAFHPHLLQRHRAVERARGQHPAVAHRAGGLYRGHRPALPQATHRPTGGVGDGGDVRRVGVLLPARFIPGRRLRHGRSRGHRWPWPQPVAAEPHPRRLSPPEPVPRLRGVHGAVRVRHRRAHHRPCG